MKPLHIGLRPALGRLAKCLSDRKGSIFVVVGAALPVLIGVLGLGADAGIWYANKRAAQTQTDAAAISGAFEKARFSASNITAAAQKEAIRNGFQNTAPNTLAIHNPPTSGAHIGDQKAVEVIMSTQQPLLFAQFFLDSVAIKTRAVASVQTTGTACVLALDPSLDSALSISGNITVNMPGCVMAANSTSSNAIGITGGPVITANSLWTAGNYTQGGSSSMTLTRPPTTQAWPIDDPYANVPPITPTPCKSYSGGATITPGSYCSGLNLPNSTVTFDPGIYYIKGGDFRVNGSTVVRCNCPGDSGVTIILTGNAADGSDIGTVDIKGGADVQLKAPSDGSAYSGLAFYQDPRAPLSGSDASFNGGALMNIQGAVYFPKRRIKWNGNNSPSAPSCTQVIGRTVLFNGNATINNTGCVAAGVEPITISGVRVVE
jgi:hypothetical protein